VNEVLEEKIKFWNTLPPVPDSLKYPPWVLKFREWKNPDNDCKYFYSNYTDFLAGKKKEILEE